MPLPRAGADWDEPAIFIWGMTIIVLYYLWDSLRLSEKLKNLFPKWSEEKIEIFQKRAICAILVAVLLVAGMIIARKLAFVFVAWSLSNLLFIPIFIGLDYLWERKKTGKNQEKKERNCVSKDESEAHWIGNIAYGIVLLLMLTSAVIIL